MLALLVASSGCAPPAATFSATHRDAVVDSVSEMLTQWRDALNKMDFAAAGRYYSADSAFRWYEDGKLTYTTAQAVRDAMTSMKPALRGMEVTFTDVKITAVSPGVAIVTSEFTEKLTDTATKVVGYAGAVSILVVHADSGWRLMIGHNSSLPPPVKK